MANYNENLGYMLFDADTNAPLTAEELGLTIEQYYDFVRASCAEQPTGVISAVGRKVYAQ